MKRILTIILAILSLIPLYYGLLGIWGGAGFANAGGPVTNGLDNQYRYLSAYYLSLFFLILWILRDLENRGDVFRLLILAIFIGGLARLYSYIIVGPASLQETGGMILELGSPILVWMQSRLKRSS